jgi:hypothetical protein
MNYYGALEETEHKLKGENGDPNRLQTQISDNYREGLFDVHMGFGFGRYREGDRGKTSTALAVFTNLGIISTWNKGGIDDTVTTKG